MQESYKTDLKFRCQCGNVWHELGDPEELGICDVCKCEVQPVSVLLIESNSLLGSVLVVGGLIGAVILLAALL